ncbi:MAG: ABC transporter substrate-binding protein [Cyanobium sp.]
MKAQWRPSRAQGLLALAVALVAAAAAAGWHLLGGDRKLRVAITSWPGYEYLYLAEQKRLGDRYGLELLTKQFTSLEDQRAAYVRGDVEVIASTIPDTIAICQEAPERCPELILVLDQSAGADALVSYKNISGIRDLVGKQVGLERTVLGEYLLLRALETKGLGLSEVQLKYDGPNALVQALEDGMVAAIVTYPPYANGLVSDPRFSVLFSSLAIPGEIVDVLAVNPAYARRHPAKLRALVRTWWAAQALARAEPEASRQLMAQREQITPAEFAASEKQISYPGPAEQIRLLSADGPLALVLARMAEQMAAAGRIAPDSPVPQMSKAFLADP